MSEEIEIIKKYIMALIEFQETKLESENLGYCQSKSTKVELDLIKRAKELLNKGVYDERAKWEKEVKEKLEELKETLSHYDEYTRLNVLEKVNVDLLDSKIEILQEILEGEKE